MEEGVGKLEDAILHFRKGAEVKEAEMELVWPCAKLAT